MNRVHAVLWPTFVLYCAIALAASGAFAASNPPFSGDSKRIQAPHPSASVPADQSASEQRGTAKSPIFVQSLPGIDSAEDAAHKQYERHEKPTLDRRLTTGTELLALFTFLLFCFTAGLWWVTYRLSKDARDSGIRQAKETSRAIAIAQQAADAAKKSAEVAESSLSAAQRAFVFCAGVQPIPHINDRIVKEYVVQIDWQNVGSTPAIDVRFTVKTMTIDKNSPSTPIFIMDKSGVITAMGPRSKCSNMVVIPITDLMDSWSGMKKIYVWARTEYIDVFNPKNLHHHEVCLIARLIHDPSELPPKDHPSYVMFDFWGTQNSSA